MTQKAYLYFDGLLAFFVCLLSCCEPCGLLFYGASYEIIGFLELAKGVCRLLGEEYLH